MNLLELIVVGLLSSIILTGLMRLYLTTKRHFELQTAMASIQERGRFISYFLRKRIRQAGYAGCENTDSPVVEDDAIKGFYKIGHASGELQIKTCIWYQQKNRFIKILYYVMNNALYARPLSSRRQEILRGVVVMHLTFGVKMASHTVKYVSASHVAHWSQVVSVDADLLLRSLNPVLKKPMKYWYQGQRLQADDNYLYQAWPILVNLRERSDAIA